MSLSLSLRDASALALLVLPVGAASLQAEGVACPETNCHLPRWAPPGLLAGDLAGEAVAIDGDLAALGLPGDDVVRTYRRENATWVLDQELVSPGSAGGKFGRELSLFGDRLLVGAPFDPAGGVLRGAVFVYERTGGGWSLADTLIGPSNFGFFGTAVAQSEQWIIASETYNGGRVQIYHNLFGPWLSAGSLNGELNHAFGSALALDGDNLLVGDWSDNDDGADAGAVHQYVLEPAGPLYLQKFGAPTPAPGDRFGVSLAFDEGWAAIGADECDSVGNESGRVYLFEAGEQFGLPYLEPHSSLTACAPSKGGRFGASLAMDGPTVLIGEPGASHAGDPGGRVRVAYRLDWIGVASWSIVDTLNPSDGVAGDRFGAAVALDGVHALAGSPGFGAPGPDAGAGHLFSLANELPGGECPCVHLAETETFGVGKPGTPGVPELGLTLPPVLGDTVVIGVSNALPGTAPILVWGTQPAAIPLDAGTLYVADPRLVNLPVVSPLGQVGVGWPIPLDVSLCHEEFYFQAVVFDPGAAGQWHTAQSQGLRASLGL